MIRMGRISRETAQAVLANTDLWVSEAVSTVAISATDVLAATTHLRRFDLNLRTADAIHIATAARLGTNLMTIDRRMAEGARALGVQTIEP